MAESYIGRVEYAASGSSRIEIDDLDSPNWRGSTSGPSVIANNTPNPWFVGVILLEGPRAWEYATADLVIVGASEGVRFEGRSAFAPMADAEAQAGRAASTSSVVNWR